MSTQLIVYPQNYNGQYNFISNPTTTITSFVSNGQNFSGISSTTLYSTDAVKPALAAIVNEHPYIVNTWYRFTTIVGPPGNWGAVTAPALAINKLELSVGSTEGHTGVYQQLTGLTVGSLYSFKIAITTGQVGDIYIATYMPNSGVEEAASGALSSNTTLVTWNFTATSTNQVFSIDYVGSVANILIESIAIYSVQSSPSGIYTDLQDGQVICDLYQEEDIPLTLSIDDFKNVAEKVQSYSKDFDLPATKRNNQIFNNMFDVTRSDDGIIFNPYVKTKCVLKQDGFLLFEGYLRLINVKDKNGEISYNVNLYSEVIALADILKDSTFSDLDFTELEHEYNKTQIKYSWGLPLWPGVTYINPSTSGFRTASTIRYPFIDWNHQYIVGGTGNLSANAGAPELVSLEQVFRPCIQLKYLINQIFAASGFNWTSNFFDSADFEKLYMDFNWGADNFPFTIDDSGLGKPLVGQIATTSFTTIESADNDYGPNIGYSSGVYTALLDNQSYNISAFYVYITDSAAAWTAVFRWKLVLGGVTSYLNVSPISGTGTVFATSAVPCTQILNTGDTLTPEFKSATASTTTFTLQGMDSLFGTSATTVATSASAATNNTILQTLRGELGQWDFLKGIMTMFNLVSMVDETDPDNILIEPYADVFINNTNGGIGNLTLKDRGIQHDWTEKIDASQMELKPLTDLNKNTIFQFVEDEDDYIFRQFKNAQSGHLYGSKEIDASGFTILQGTEEIIAEPFAATVSKPLMSQFPNFITPAIYAMGDDGTTEGFDNSPRIFYDNGVKSSGTTYFIPSQNGLFSENQEFFLQFSHLSAIPSVVSSPPAATDTRDFVFESAQLLSALGSPPTDNLYSTYWQPYFNELYNPNTRTMKLKVNLSPSDIASFKFYDTVFIKNRVFRVNKIEYKPNTLAKVEFILIP